MNVGDLLWLAAWCAAFSGYAFAVLFILKDLFTDPVLGGGAKALWVLAVILAPFVTVAVYLIARGEGMRRG